MCLIVAFILAVVAGRLLNEKHDGTGHKKQKTNADMIRSMSDEELVCFILEVGYPGNTVCSCSDNCENCWMKWLKSPSLRGELNE